MSSPTDDELTSDQPMSGVPQDVTLVEVLTELSTRGFTTELDVDDAGLLCCRACGACAEVREVEIDSFRRLEGASDPADMAAVLAACCSACGRRGTAVVRYGPEAGPGDAALLASLPPQQP